MKRHARRRSRRYNSFSKSVTYKLRFCLFVFTLYIIYFLFIVSSNLLLSLSKENERSITKLETVIQKEKVGKQAAQTEEAVAWGLLIHTQEQLQALKAEGQVCNRVRVRSSLLFSSLLIITLLGILILLFCLKLGIHDNNERCA